LFIDSNGEINIGVMFFSDVVPIKNPAYLFKKDGIFF